MKFDDFCWFLLIFADFWWFFLWFLMIFDDFFMIFDELWWFLLIFHHLNLHFGQAKAKSSWWLQIYHGDRWRCRWTWWTSKWWKWSRFCCGPCLRNPSSCRPGRAGWENGGKMDGKMESVSIQVETTSRWSRPRSTLVTMPHHARWRVWRISPATNENFCSWKRRSSFCRSTKIFDLTLSSLWLFLSSFCCSSSSFSPFFAIFCHFRPRTKSPPSFPILDASLRLAEGASHKTGILGDNDLMSEISTSRCRCCELQEMNQEVWLVKHVSFTTRVHHGD